MDQNAIFKAISDRFRHLEANVLPNLAVLISLLVLLVFLYLLYRRGEHNKSVKEWRSEYQRLIRQFDLTINELDLINRMSPYLDDPDRKILLLRNRNTFHHALLLLQRREGEIPRFAESLNNKLFGRGASELPEGFERLFGLGRPVRYICPDGSVFGGNIIQRENEKIILGNVHPLEASRHDPDVRGEGRLFIQDFRGLVSHEVKEKIVLSETSFQLNLSRRENAGKNGFRLPDIYLFFPGENNPVKTHFYRVSEGMGTVENPEGLLKMDQSVKIALQPDASHHYHVNASVRWVSLNKRYAKLKFGYLNEKFY